jgi:putative inorganic carbon (HCO3(-)) transporter
MNIPVALLVIMALVGYGVSADPTLSKAKLWGIILQAAVFFAVLNNARRERDIFFLLRLLVAGTAVLAVFSLVGTDWGQVRLIEAPGVYDRIPVLIRGLPGSGAAPEQELFNPREVGAAIAMLLPLSVILFWIAPNRWDRPLAVVSFLSGSLILILSQALMGFFGLAVALLLIAVWWRRWILGPVLVGLVFLGVVLLSYGPERLVTTALTVEDPIGIGVVLRIDMWSRALALIRDLPFTGIGLNTFPLIQTQMNPGFLLGPEPHAHNLFIQTALDLGLPGLLAFLWLLFSFTMTVIFAYRQTNKRYLQLLLVGLSAGIVAYIAGGLLDTVTLGAKPVPVLWAMFGLVGAVASLEDRGERNKPRVWTPGFRRWLLATFLGFFFLGLILFPGVRNRNLGLIFAQKALVTARQTGDLPATEAERAISFLEEALDRDTQNAQLFGVLGSLYAWQGAHESALKALHQRVVLDDRDALGRYAPFELWKRQITGQSVQDSWADTNRIYSQWRDRFPDRAEFYVLKAFVLGAYMGDKNEAKNWLQNGLENGAEPRELLVYNLKDY